jgi:chemotaxis protein methyltransferase CheR
MDKAALLTETEFSRLCEFLYRRTGMLFTEGKRYYVDRRLADRMAATGDARFAAYFQRLLSGRDGEIEHFVNAFTVNETYFYREDHQLECLTRELLTRRIATKPSGQPVRIWCIPCSTGEEPYSVAIRMLENWPLVDAYDIEIIGSDIDTSVLKAARDGIYGRRALMRLSTGLIDKYFEPLDDDRWRIIEDLRQSVHFTAINVVDPEETRSQGCFDVIFCRNMLIYFDDASRRLAAENLYESLLPGGYVCLGHSESMSRISSLFEVCRYEQAIVYRRPMEGGDD